MKRFLLLLPVLVFLIVPRTQAKDLQALFSYATFYNPAEGPYVETYLKIFGPTAEYIQLDNGNFQASMEVTLLFKKGDKIETFRKYNLLSSELSDTTDLIPHFIDQQRIPLSSGTYQLELHLKDNHSEVDPLEHSELLAIDFDQTKVRFSDFQFIDTYSTTNKDNILTKSGFDLVPYVGDFFPAEKSEITFYIELYNLASQLGNQTDFLYRFYIESFETNFSLGEYSKFQRQKASVVNPILATLPMASLPSGNYNLVVEARDRNNDLILMNKIFFMRSNPGIQMDLSDIASVDVTATFAERITDLDSIRFYVGSLTPIANMLESQFARNVIQTEDLEKMQKFLFNFWKTRNEADPESEWNAYLKQVMQVEEAYKTRIKPGYETDMGRVWLKYGAPDDVQESVHEPNSYPYIIWHFYALADQNDKRFIFYNPHLVGTEYFLLHSDAKGEVYNPYWQYELSSRNTYLRDYDNTDVDNGWGSRARELIRR